MFLAIKPGQGFWLFIICLWLKMEAVCYMYGLKLKKKKRKESKTVLLIQSRIKESFLHPGLTIEIPPPTILGVSAEKDFIITHWNKTITCKPETWSLPPADKKAHLQSQVSKTDPSAPQDVLQMHRKESLPEDELITFLIRKFTRKSVA